LSVYISRRDRLKLEATEYPSASGPTSVDSAPSTLVRNRLARTLELRGLKKGTSQTTTSRQLHSAVRNHLALLRISSKYTMAPKRSAREPTPSSTATTQSSATAAGSFSSIPSKASYKSSSNQSPQEIALGIWQNYLDTTPQRTKLIDVFMAFLVVVGVLQFVYCVIAGNYVCVPY
jgi:hypothetical protein